MLFCAAGFEIHPGGIHNPSAFCYQDKSVWCLAPTCSAAAAGAKVRVSRLVQPPPSTGWCHLKPFSSHPVSAPWSNHLQAALSAHLLPSERIAALLTAPVIALAAKQVPLLYSVPRSTWWEVRRPKHGLAWEPAVTKLANSALLVHGVGMQILILPRCIQGFLGVFCYCTVDVLWAVPPLNDLSPLMTRWKGFIQVWFMILDKRISEFRSTATATSFWLVLTEDPSPEVRADKDYSNFWELGLQRLCQPPGQ